MADPILVARGLRVAFGAVAAVDGVDFDLAAGETLALVGESGSGKSLTALASMGLQPPAAAVSGSVLWEGSDLIGAPAETLRRLRGNRVGFVFQEPMTSLNPLHTVERQIGETLALHQGMGRAAARARTLELLTEVGIRDPETRLGAYPHELSGGQRQRVMIAMALANDPKLLIADEPTTALDVTIQAQILALLADLQRAKGLAMFFITHDLGIVRKFAQRVAVMRKGRIVEQGPTARIFAEPAHAYTRDLLAAEPSGRPAPVAPDAPVVLAGDRLRVWFPVRAGLFRRTVGHVKAVTDVSLTVRRGETVGLVGESGSGKTTLAMAALRLLPAGGRVAVLGRDVTELPRRELRHLRRDLQVVFQDPYGSLSPRMSIAEIVAEGLGVHGVSDGRRPRDAVAEALVQVGLDPSAMDRYPHEFSGGQRQRIAIARAMILRPKLVVLDEPTSALDRTVQTQIVELLRGLQAAQGLGYLFISHDLRVVGAMAHRILVMRGGEVVEEGPAEAILTRPATAYARALIAAALSLEVAEAAE